MVSWRITGSSQVTNYHSHHYGKTDHHKMTADHLHPVTLILLAEAHVAVPVPFCHAGVVDHEEVDLKTVCTSPLNLVVVSPYELDHFYTAAFTGGGWGHVALKIYS